jgi:penicillin-binding protein 1C
LSGFIQGTEQTRIATDSVAKPSMDTRANRSFSSREDAKTRRRITAPASGTIIALDPDIPPNRQRVSFTADGPGARWLMDGKPFGQGPQAQWLPWPGRHVVRLTDARGAVLDEIRLEVRGAAVKVAQASSDARR